MIKLKQPDLGAHISINFWNKKTKIRIHSDTFLECTSLVFLYVDYWMRNVKRKFSNCFTIYLSIGIPVNFQIHLGLHLNNTGEELSYKHFYLEEKIITLEICP